MVTRGRNPLGVACALGASAWLGLAPAGTAPRYYTGAEAPASCVRPPTDRRACAEQLFKKLVQATARGEEGFEVFHALLEPRLDLDRITRIVLDQHPSEATSGEERRRLKAATGWYLARVTFRELVGEQIGTVAAAPASADGWIRVMIAPPGKLVALRSSPAGGPVRYRGLRVDRTDFLRNINLQLREHPEWDVGRIIAEMDQRSGRPTAQAPASDAGD